MKRNLTCIICPRGCSITVESTADGLKVTGNTCSRGKEYAINECTHPKRTVTSVVKVANRPDVMVSVKTAGPVPKEHIFDTMEIIRKISANAPVSIGDVLYKDVYGTDIVATKSIC